MKTKKNIEGFRVKVWDGSIWVIPYTACVDAYVKIRPSDKKLAIESMSRMTHEEISEIFQETEWSEFEKHAVRIQDPSDLNMAAMWETAEITNTP